MNVRGLKVNIPTTTLERGQDITTTFCINAMGSIIPPGLIFFRVCLKAELSDGAPLESMCHMSGEFLCHYQHNLLCLYLPML